MEKLKGYRKLIAAAVCGIAVVVMRELDVNADPELTKLLIAQVLAFVFAQAGIDMADVFAPQKGASKAKDVKPTALSGWKKFLMGPVGAVANSVLGLVGVPIPAAVPAVLTAGVVAEGAKDIVGVISSILKRK